jgi:hypothetical protein
MVSATLNQDLKELASISLKEPLSFSVHQQQRKADLANLKLTQYLVRLKFEDVTKVPKKKKPTKKKEKKWVDKDGSDFDSEEEYGKEHPDSDEESYEMDDGKTVLKDEKAESKDSELDQISEADEEGEASMSEDIKEESVEDIED